ncbi:ATP synthase subunit I [Comamonas antarctica]|uniref:ATP synthase subunit I n=1 Tax=Comamonas antarctica TaxID=2743470 RepID=UPI0028EABAD5|nr:ATP synthase subunit I [Comamonas antarctica]
MNKKYAPETEAEAEDSDFNPLTAEEAQQWRQRNPPVSPWRVVAGQVLAGTLVALLAWLVSGRSAVGWSAAYGALAVVLPAALFARGLARQQAAPNAGAAMVGFFGWELAKLMLCIAMLAMAPKLVTGLSWLALLTGKVVTMKTYWIALLLRRSGVRKTD